MACAGSSITAAPGSDDVMRPVCDAVRVGHCVGLRGLRVQCQINPVEEVYDMSYASDEGDISNPGPTMAG